MLENVFTTIESLARSLQERLSVQTVYGEPITAGNVTIVPVARVSFGFGGGGGGGGGGPAEGGQDALQGGSGGGGGGGGLVAPTGYIEIIDGDSRWVPLEKPRSEQALRALTAALGSLPGGGKRGVFRRLALAAIAQGITSHLGGLGSMKPPSMAAGFPFRGSTAEETE